MENQIVNQASRNTKQTLKVSVDWGHWSKNRQNKAKIKNKNYIPPKQLVKTCQWWETQSVAVAVRSDWGEVLRFVGSFSSLALVDAGVWFDLFCVSLGMARFLKQMEMSLHFK